MAYLIPNSTPAQRARGQSFGEQFRSAARVALNRGTVFGTPTIDFGAVCNGTTDYIKYQMSGNEFNSPVISIIANAKPNFDYDIDDNIVLFTTNGELYKIEKRLNVNNNVLQVSLGGTLISSIPSSVYGPFWRVGQNNQFAIYGTSGNTSVKLNDNVILANDATAWTKAKVEQLYVGASSVGAKFFDGTIFDLDVYKSILESREISDFYNHSTYNYRNKAVLDLPMLAAQDEPTQTLDVSGNSNPGVFTGAVAKLTKRGYTLPGSAFISGNSSGLYNTTGFTMVSAFVPRFASDSDAIVNLFNSTSTDYAISRRNQVVSSVLRIYFGGSIIQSIPYATWSPHWVECGLNVIIAASDSDTDLTDVDYNGYPLLVDDATAWSPVDVATYTIGSTTFVGDFIQAMALPFKMTRLQRLDLYGKIQRSINRV